MVSQTAEYALRAVLYLAERDETVPVPVGDMARALVPFGALSSRSGTDCAPACTLEPLGCHDIRRNRAL